MSELLFPGDVPANPTAKPGYRLDFHDEFDRASLDATKRNRPPEAYPKTFTIDYFRAYQPNAGYLQ